jgi:hypothetical protein
MRRSGAGGTFCSAVPCEMLSPVRGWESRQWRPGKGSRHTRQRENARRRRPARNRLSWFCGRVTGSPARVTRRSQRTIDWGQCGASPLGYCFRLCCGRPGCWSWCGCYGERRSAFANDVRILVENDVYASGEEHLDGFLTLRLRFSRKIDCPRVAAVTAPAGAWA